MPWPKTGATHKPAQLGFLNKDSAIKGFVVWNISTFEQAKLSDPKL